MFTTTPLLILGALLSATSVAKACSCMRGDLKDDYCRSDFVIKVHVQDEKRVVDVPDRNGDDLDRVPIYDENFATYHYNVDILEVYRSTGDFDGATKKIVASPSFLCGYRPRPENTYVIMGFYRTDGGETFLGTSLCSRNLNVGENHIEVDQALKEIEDGIEC